MQNPPSLTTFAEVRANDQVMRYRRAGAGRPLLVLRSSLDPLLLWSELEAALVENFRVLTPELPAAAVDVAVCLRNFLEGAGLERVILVADDAFCIAALEMALLNADQVERMVLVPAGTTSETGLDGTVATSIAGADVPVPMLVVRRGLSAHEAIPLLMHFLCSGETAAAVG
jgi:pimeloyl-ACP methyl ester carboxylesterase